MDEQEPDCPSWIHEIALGMVDDKHTAPEARKQLSLQTVHLRNHEQGSVESIQPPEGGETEYPGA
jgi:hypothetical protein